MARLLYTDEGGRQQAIELDPARPQTVIGRQADCEIVAYDTSVSRRHCIVVPEDGGYIVVDLGSANGTLVNDVRITRRRLASDDVIRCGAFAVRFVEAAADSRESLADRYRRARGGGAEVTLRVQLERLQAFNDNQNQRLLQLQEELTRSESERVAASERWARADAEARFGRQRIAELDEQLRRSMAAIELRERELDAVRAIPAPPPPLGSPPPVASLVDAALAAENVALRAQISSLHGALAVDDAYDRSARLMPTVDRWQALTVARAQLALARDERAALEARLRDAEARLVEANARARAAEARREEADGRARAAEARARDADHRGRPPRSLADAAARAGKTTGGLLAGLGGLGETARGGRSEAAAARGGVAGVVPNEAQLGELQAAMSEAEARRAQALAAAEALVERLVAHRERAAMSGMGAVQLAELVDLGRAVRLALGDPTRSS